MKKMFLCMLLTISSILAYSQCPVSAKRNNGNQPECQARLQLLFNAMPTNTGIDSIVIDGVKQTWTATYLETTTPGSQFQLEYCIPTENFPPIGMWVIYFTGSAGQPCMICVDCGGPPLAISYLDVKATRINSKQVKVVFVVDADHDVRHYKVRLSLDGKNFKDKVILVPSTVGKQTFQAIITL